MSPLTFHPGLSFGQASVACGNLPSFTIHHPQCGHDTCFTQSENKLNKMLKVYGGRLALKFLH